MKLPVGTESSIVHGLRGGRAIEHLRGFQGVIETGTARGTGFILIRNSELVAAFFEDPVGQYRGIDALRHLMMLPAGESIRHTPTFTLRSYSGQEFAEAVGMCTEENLLTGPSLPGTAFTSAPLNSTGITGTVSCTVDEGLLHRIMDHPGVIAVSAFYEGFPVLSLGNADFEHLAARAEDFLRAGTTIARDMNLGHPDQLILETLERICIIVPCGDLFLCIITSAETRLGQLHVLLKSIPQKGKNEI